ncbi:adenosine kinase-like isoform X2 [Zootermopsis nevadensis]|nr:adenosine kinase-like isoform X2 [Zootermopsis nevadensis]
MFQWVVNCPLYSVFFGGIGNDDEGKLLEKLVKNSGIETRYKYHNDYPTGSCLALISGENRSLVCHLGAANIYEPSDLLQHMQILEQVNIIYIESFFISHSYEVALLLLKLCQDKKIALVFNINAVYMCNDFPNKVSHLAKCANILFGNKEEFKALGKVMNLEYESTKDIALALHNMSNQGHFLESCDLGKYLNKMGKIIVVTDGKDSVLCVYGNGCNKPSVIKFDVPAVRQELIRDTTGAGDSFLSGFLAGVFAKHNMETCIAWGCWTAQQVIQLIGCQVPPYPSDEIHKIRY